MRSGGRQGCRALKRGRQGQPRQERRPVPAGGGPHLRHLQRLGGGAVPLLARLLLQAGLKGGLVDQQGAAAPRLHRPAGTRGRQVSRLAGQRAAMEPGRASGSTASFQGAGQVTRSSLPHTHTPTLPHLHQLLAGLGVSRIHQAPPLLMLQHQPVCICRRGGGAAPADAPKCSGTLPGQPSQPGCRLVRRQQPACAHRSSGGRARTVGG